MNRGTTPKFLPTLKKFKELLMSVALMILWAVLYGQTYNISSLAFSDGLGPAYTPRVVLICLIVMTALLILRETVRLIRKAAADKKPATEAVPDAEAKKQNEMLVRGAVSIVSLVVFVLLIQPLGFVISSILYVISQMFMTAPKEKRRPILFIVVAVVVVLVTYLFFKNVTHIALPSGILSFF